MSYLTRGDVFGETETLGDVPRKNAVRTCEPASIQRFKKEHFPELIRRVPKFFYYLSQQIATQVAKMTDLAFVQSSCLELSGNLANFDMVTIYQTILNSTQTGELSIVNEHGEQSSVFYFEEGQTRYGRYYHLTGEEAFWQLFLCEKLSGTFSLFPSPNRMPTRPPPDRACTATRRICSSPRCSTAMSSRECRSRTAGAGQPCCDARN